MKRYFKPFVLLVLVSMILTSCLMTDIETAQQFIQEGDKYFEHQKYEEAIVRYNKAIQMNPESAIAYNNIAAALTFLDKPEEAITYCEKALLVDPHMEMAYSNMGLALNILERYEEALIKFDKAIEIDSGSDFAYYNKGDSLLNLDRYEEALECFNKAIAINPDYSNAYLGKAVCFYYIGDYSEGILACNKAIELNSSYKEAYLWKAKSLILPNDYDNAISAVNSAIDLDAFYLDAYMTKLSILYNIENYIECIKLGNQAIINFPENEDIIWYIADCYSAQYKYKEAIEKYKEVLNINPNNEVVLTYLGWSYYFIQDYTNAESVLSKALEIDKDSDIALELKEAIKETKLPQGQRIVEFIKNNYLYIDKVKNFKSKSEKFSKKSSVTHEDIELYLKAIIPKDDYFTFILYGEDYDELENMESENQLEHKAYGKDSYYIRIKAFNSSVGHEFRKIVKDIKNSYNKNLIIDLRDNSGGYTEPSCLILDKLLPECTTSTFLYKDGTKDVYNSDVSYIRFNKIILLVNENSASSSELLALGLKLKLQDVIIIGRNTYGKGVGQQVFENIKEKYAIFLVNFYWSIDNKNINGKGIKPDILVKSNKDSDFFNEVDKIIN